MNKFRVMVMVLLCGSTVRCTDKSLDSRATGNQLIEVDKVLALWNGHQARSVYAVQPLLNDDEIFSKFDGSGEFDTLRHQRSLLQKINGLERAIRDQCLIEWSNVQTEALNLLRSSRGVSPEENLGNPLDILNKQESELELLYDKRKKLVDILGNYERQE